MRIAVTGGAGFLGKKIGDELITRGHDVVVVDRVATDFGDRQVEVADIRDRNSLATALAECDAVYHCAAIADLDEARRNPSLAVDVNVMGTIAVLEAAHEVGVQRFMHASSVYVFSRGGSIYRTTKQAAEHLVEDLSVQYNLRSTILRFGSLYGPGSDGNNAIFKIVSQAVERGKVDFWGDGTEVREYIHITDAAELAVDALDPRFAGECIHITGRERVTTRELLDMVNEMLGGGIDINVRDEPFEGRYRLTPYSHERPLGSRLTSDTYVDLGLGVLEMIRLIDAGVTDRGAIA